MFRTSKHTPPTYSLMLRPFSKRVLFLLPFLFSKQLLQLYPYTWWLGIGGHVPVSPTCPILFLFVVLWLLIWWNKIVWNMLKLKTLTLFWWNFKFLNPSLNSEILMWFIVDRTFNCEYSLFVSSQSDFCRISYDFSKFAMLHGKLLTNPVSLFDFDGQIILFYFLNF